MKQFKDRRKTMNDSTLGIGIIGCGTIAERMINAWRPHMKNARLTAVSDVNAERVGHFREQFGIERGYADESALLQDPAVDAVLILTPNFLHAPQTMAAARAGKHVLCQKPLALTVDEAQRMIEAAQDGGVTLMAAFVKRFWPFYTAVKKLIDDGALGRVVSIRTQFSHSGIGKYYVPASNWFNDRAKAGGGPLADLGVHHFDVMRWLVGAEVATVSAEMTNSNGHADALEDNALVNLSFSNGVVGQGYYSFTTVAPPGVTLERLEVYGTTGSAIVMLSHPARVVVQYCTEVGPLANMGWVDLPVTEPIPAFGLMLQHFADCVREGRQPMTVGEDGLRSVEIAEHAYVSAREGRRVSIAAPSMTRAVASNRTGKRG
jgi:UDP-N-acetylglucosamine 3-dehydrogenase